MEFYLLIDAYMLSCCVFPFRLLFSLVALLSSVICTSNSSISVHLNLFLFFSLAESYLEIFLFCVGFIDIFRFLSRFFYMSFFVDSLILIQSEYFNFHFSKEKISSSCSIAEMMHWKYFWNLFLVNSWQHNKMITKINCFIQKKKHTFPILNHFPIYVNDIDELSWKKAQSQYLFSCHSSGKTEK